ncbi:hypothetical protein AB6A40_011152, partial [Gnathostoma spinigerum]
HEIALHKQSERFHALRPFSDLISWLKVTHVNAHGVIVDKYVQHTKLIYQKDLSRFFEAVNNELNKIGAFERRLSLRDGDSSISQTTPEAVNVSKQITNLVEIVLGEVGSVVETEQKFCTRFFHVSSEPSSAIETQSNASSESNKTSEKQISDQIRVILSPLFESVQEHMDHFIKHCCRISPSIVFVLLVLLSKKALRLQDATSYFSVMIFGRLVVLIKRQFDVFMVSQVHSLYQKNAKRGN